MLGRKIVVGLAGVLMFLAAENVVAQDCGNECKMCTGNFKWEGTHYGGSTAPYNMDCIETGPGGGCEDCGLQSASEDAIPAEFVAGVVLQSAETDASAVRAAYGDRILWAGGRGVLLVTGTGCQSATPVLMLRISATKADALRNAGVGRYRTPVMRNGG